MDVGTKILYLRKSKKISQPELAHRLGISQTALCDIESGKTRKIDFMLMNKIFKEFGANNDYFIDIPVKAFAENKPTYHSALIDNCLETLIEQINQLIESNKQKDIIIKELKDKLKLL